MLIKDKSFGGERPLFGIHDTRLENVTITEGESGIKCCRNIEADGCRFIGKYPLWHVEDSVITNCFFEVGSRSAIWYSNGMLMRDCIIDAPKFFREMRGLTLENVQLNDADETFWRVKDLKLRNVRLHEGTYPVMFCENVDVDGWESDSKYVFQYVKNAVIRNAKIVTKDAFWETENVTIYDSVLDGEYLGWHSKNLHLVRCHIAGEQPLCYIDGLVLEDCTFDPACDRAFEDSSNIDAHIHGHITEIKNPISGSIVADSVGKVTIDEYSKEGYVIINGEVVKNTCLASYTSPRRGTNCVKWDECDDPEVIPMWVADMDFRTAPCVVEAMQRRLNHGVFGYNIVPESFYQAIIDWQTRRHGWTPKREWIQYTIGVVPALSAIIKGLTKAGDAVMIQTPVYNCFFSSIRNNGCRIVEAPLTWISGDERFMVDFKRFEETIEQENVKIFLLCSPHNPAGRVWTHDELTEIATICKRHNVVVVADEIHSEFINPKLGRDFQPFAPVAEKVGTTWVVANAPSKAFNTAGLQTAYIICDRADLRERIDRAINDNEVCDLNTFGPIALEAAYSKEGEAWLDKLVNRIYTNYDIFIKMMKEALPNIPIAHLEGTYLAWVDVSELTDNTERLCAQIRSEYKVWVNAGEMYGKAGFIRVNLACEEDTLKEGIRRLCAALMNN